MNNRINFFSSIKIRIWGQECACRPDCIGTNANTDLLITYANALKLSPIYWTRSSFLECLAHVRTNTLICFVHFRRALIARLSMTLGSPLVTTRGQICVQDDANSTNYHKGFIEIKFLKDSFYFSTLELYENASNSTLIS